MARYVSAVLPALFLGAIFASCASASPPRAEATHDASEAYQDPEPPAKKPPASDSAEPEPTSDESNDEEDAGPLACPEDMILVEGEYCTHIDNDAKPDAHGNTPGAGAKDITVIEREC